MQNNLAKYIIFGKTLEIPIVTWTNNKEDIPPKKEWDEDYYIEMDEDWYGLMWYARKGKTVRVITNRAVQIAIRKKEIDSLKNEGLWDNVMDGEK
jgi:hypothetical protein